MRSSADSLKWCVVENAISPLFDTKQVDSYKTIDVNYEQMDAWRKALSLFEPPLVGIASIELNFVMTVWNLFRGFAA